MEDGKDDQFETLESQSGHVEKQLADDEISVVDDISTLGRPRVESPISFSTYTPAE